MPCCSCCRKKKKRSTKYVSCGTVTEKCKNSDSKQNGKCRASQTERFSTSPTIGKPLLKKCAPCGMVKMQRHCLTTDPSIKCPCRPNCCCNSRVKNGLQHMPPCQGRQSVYNPLVSEMPRYTANGLQPCEYFSCNCPCYYSYY